MVGCERISEGCKNCYAVPTAKRVENFGIAPHYAGVTTSDGGNWSGKIAIAPEHVFTKLGRFPAGTHVFINSMSDLFHPRAPDEVRVRAFDIIAGRPDVTYQVLTKRPEEIAPFLLRNNRAVPENLWLGATVECTSRLARVDILRSVPAKVRFLSVEPMLDDVAAAGLDLGGIHWIICGGESGHRARPMNPDWVRRLRDLCIARNVPFFFKQWGAWRNNPYAYDADGAALRRTEARAIDQHGKGGSLLDGCTWHEMPDANSRGDQ